MMIMRECFNKAAHFIWFQSLFKAWITTCCFFIFIVSRITHSTICLHILEPAQSWLPSILHYTFLNFWIIHSYLCIYGIIRDPPILHSIRIFLVIFEINKFAVVSFTQCNLCDPSYVTGNNTFANYVHYIYNISAPYANVPTLYFLLKLLPHQIMHMNERTRPWGLPSKCFQRYSCLSYLRIVHFHSSLIWFEILFQKHLKG